MMNNNKMTELRRGDVYIANLPINENSKIQGGRRPVVLVDNDKALEKSPTLKYVPFTSKIKKEYFSFHVLLKSLFFKKQTMALIESEDLLDRGVLEFKIGTLSEEDMNKIDMARLLQSGIDMLLIEHIMQLKAAC